MKPSATFDVKADVAEGVNAIEKIAEITEWLEAEQRLPNGIEWEWKGDQEDQTESMAFLSQAFAGALGLMFVILLAQFNSFYNSVLVLLGCGFIHHWRLNWHDGYGPSIQCYHDRYRHRGLGGDCGEQ